jgi:hypothetical protein
MSTHKHYFIEQRPDGRYAATAKGAHRASRLFDTQREAIRQVDEWNRRDRPDVERVRDTKSGSRDKWRPKDK